MSAPTTTTDAAKALESQHSEEARAAMRSAHASVKNNLHVVIESQAEEIARLTKERDELAAWKESAMTVMSPMQEIGQALRLTLGKSDKILASILQLQKERDEARANEAKANKFRERAFHKRNEADARHHESIGFIEAQRDALARDNERLRKERDAAMGDLESETFRRKGRVETLNEALCEALSKRDRLTVALINMVEMWDFLQPSVESRFSAKVELTLSKARAELEAKP